MEEKKEPIIGVLTERKDVPIKLIPMGTYYLLGQIVVDNPDTKILMLEGQTVGDDFPRWRVLAKGPACEAPIEVGDSVLLTSGRSGRNVAVTGTPYKMANEVEILAVLEEEESLVWDEAIADNVAAVQGVTQASKIVKPGEA